jgi:3-oxoacyl-[acyl-carrier-protein] synthase II
MSVPVAVTGLGVLSAYGHGVEAFWDGLAGGESALRQPARACVDGVALAAEVPGLEVRTFARTPLGRRIDRTSLLALAACRLALADAGDPLRGTAVERTGISLGSGLGNLGETTVFLDRLFARGTGNPLVFPNLVMNAPLSYVSIELGVTGPTAFLTEQEASGEAAIAYGAQLVADGAVEVCLAGAADEYETIVGEVLRDAGVLTCGVPRPLEDGADGTCPGEGAAVLVLEPLARAEGRGARIYARVAPHPGFAVPAPVHGWARDPAALADGLAPLLAGVDAVVAAASGAPALDALEGRALAHALRGRAVPVTAPRAAIGDFGAAGALAVAAGALAVHHGLVPPTPGPRGGGRCGLDVVTGAGRPGRVRSALVDGLARGGACRPVVLEAVHP